MPFEDFPRDAWDDLGRTPDGHWRLRLRPGFLPQSLADLNPSEPDGAYVEVQLTTDQLRTWERRWVARLFNEEILLDELTEIRRQRLEAEVRVSRRASSVERQRRGSGQPTVEEIERAIATLHDRGVVSDRTGQPTREQVAEELHVSLSALKRQIHEIAFRWPRSSL